MKKEKIMDVIFTIIGVIGFLEFSFLRGLFTGPIVMLICGITGVISFIYKMVKRAFSILGSWSPCFICNDVYFGYLKSVLTLFPICSPRF